jgi:hypothetical protein
MSTAKNPFRYFHSSPDVIVLMYIRFPTCRSGDENGLCCDFGG